MYERENGRNFFIKVLNEEWIFKFTNMHFKIIFNQKKKAFN